MLIMGFVFLFISDNCLYENTGKIYWKTKLDVPMLCRVIFLCIHNELSENICVLESVVAVARMYIGFLMIPLKGNCLLSFYNSWVNIWFVVPVFEWDDSQLADWWEAGCSQDDWFSVLTSWLVCWCCLLWYDRLSHHALWLWACRALYERVRRLV